MLLTLPHPRGKPVPLLLLSSNAFGCGQAVTDRGALRQVCGRQKQGDAGGAQPRRPRGSQLCSSLAVVRARGPTQPCFSQGQVSEGDSCLPGKAKEPGS